MKNTTLTLAVVLVSLLVSFAPVSVIQDSGILIMAQAGDAYGLHDAAAKAGIPKDVSLPQTIGIVLFTAISLIGVLFLVLMVYGGFLWMTAGGNSEKTKKAGAIMRNGAIGLIIVLSAYAITYFVIIQVLVPATPPPPPPPGP